MSPVNFSGKNLRGQSFRGQDLTNASFDRADIRGTDFRAASLIGATFHQAKAGLTPDRSVKTSIAAAVLSAVIGLIATFISVFSGYLLFPFSVRGEQGLAPTVVLALAIVLFGVTIRQGLERALFAAAIAGLGLGALLGSATGTVDGIVAGAIAVSLTAVISVGIVMADAIVVTVAQMIAGKIAAWITIAMLVLGSTIGAKFGSSIGLTVAQVMTRGTLTAAKAAAAPKAELAGIIGSVTAACLIVYVSSRIKDAKFALVWNRAIELSALGGTCFEAADLTDANFTEASLKSTDFRNATLTHTKFYQAKYLDRAKVKGTILDNQTVRSLLVTHQGQHRSYVGLDFRGANLAGAILTGADFTDANLSNAVLQSAQLEQTRLIRTQAIATNFQSANLTGACIEAWNIDSTTRLNHVHCDYLYLRHSQQERRPSSGHFAAGDFTELFQQVIDTIDLIFRSGVDQKAFNYSLHQLQIENKGAALSIRSLEKKGNGVVVVRVDIPAELDKAKLHADFTQHYEQAATAIAANYQAELQAKDEQIAIYRSQLSDWKEIVQLLAQQSTPLDTAPQTKLVVLIVGEGDLNLGFPVTLQIGSEVRFRAMQFTKGRLAPAPELFERYQQWRITYRKCMNANLRIDVPDTQVTNVSRQDFFQDCLTAVDRLQHELNLWLNAESFRPIKERLLEQLAPSDSIRFVLQTHDRQLRQLPLQLWEFFDRYTNAELAFSTPDYEPILFTRPATHRVRVLAILGDNRGIDINGDREILNQLPDAEVTFLVEPMLQTLNDQLWSQSWDILFFAGHGSSDHETGFLQINQHDRFSVGQLKHALKKAISQGLKLAIFNSCDGLGLAHELLDLQLPQFIVMREPVPDQVAQAFLKYFLGSFSRGQSLYRSVREAREQLQGLENHFPCATWLPVIYQNPSESSLTWRQFQGV